MTCKCKKNAGAMCDVIFECPKCKGRVNNFWVADMFDYPSRLKSMDKFEEDFYLGELQRHNRLHKQECGVYMKEIKRGSECRTVICKECKK